MFEITPEEIATLNDTDLRALVHRLAECEVKAHGYSAAYVMAGGAQDAADEGIDVHVALPSGKSIDGFIPRPSTGFQVKNMDMPPARVRKEMRPSTVAVRPSIEELAKNAGAYIIATSGSATYSMLKARLAAMRDCVKELPQHDELVLDYYDRTRLASWVRDHRTLIPWIREKIGKAINGWRSYRAWSCPGEGIQAEYLVEDRVRVLTGNSKDGEGLRVLDAISQIRTLLGAPRNIVRLIGLSGVGKTRFVQALFDSEVGQHNLDPLLAIYGNTSDEPDPSPRNLLTDLVSAGDRAILVVDNCTSELHRSLSDLCRVVGSNVSLITIEHDVRDDVPEGTNVFTLEASSADLIEKLVARRFPVIPQVTIRTIAENSDGNSRIAIALAGTFGKNETISALTDDEQFRRLFNQGYDHDDSLLLAAQSMSLVYSFNGENVSDDKDAELFRLGNLAGKSALEMYRYTAMLYERDLVQRRGVFRALLPQALANRLAKSALKCIPPTVIEEHLVKTGPERLLRSFSRRLGYLSDCTEAISIARKWLSPEGLLADIANLNDLGKSMFENVAAVAPDAALSALERALLTSPEETVVRAGGRFTLLIRLLAHESPMFERCAALLLKIAAFEGIEDRSDSAGRNVFVSLFTLYLSGTHATVEQRISVTKPLLFSHDEKLRSVGLKALGSLLEAAHFTAHYTFEFGSRSRDYGFSPRTADEVKHWFSSSLKLAAEVGCSNADSAVPVRKVVASHFRTLWTSAQMYDDLHAICTAINSTHFWPDGWVAVRATQGYDGPGFSPEVSARLSALEHLLQPKNVEQSVLAIVLGNESYSYDPADVAGEDQHGRGEMNSIAKRVARTDEMARSLGQVISQDPIVLGRLITQLLTGRGLLWIFGRGLAEGSKNLLATWNYLKVHAAATPREHLNIEILRGFLHAVRTINPVLAGDLLEDAIDEETLGFWYPALEASGEIDSAGANRLMRSISVGKTPMEFYNHISAGGFANTIPPQDMKELILAIAAKPKGFAVATDVLSMRLHGHMENAPVEIRKAGLNLLGMLSFTAKDQSADYNLGEVAKACLSGHGGADWVERLCAKLKMAIDQYKTHLIYYGDFFRALLSTHPKAALEGMCPGDGPDLEGEIRVIKDIVRNEENLFGTAPDSDLLAWCDEKPMSRYPALAGAVSISTRKSEAGELEWSPIALCLLDKAPDRVEVLKRFVYQIRSTFGFGSPLTSVETNAGLLDKLQHYPDAVVAEFAAEQRAMLAQYAEQSKQLEATLVPEESGWFE